jgi:hypothetical protein
LRGLLEPPGRIGQVLVVALVGLSPRGPCKA